MMKAACAANRAVNTTANGLGRVVIFMGWFLFVYV
jgi:hypothetical protein